MWQTSDSRATAAMQEMCIGMCAGKLRAPLGDVSEIMVVSFTVWRSSANELSAKHMMLSSDIPVIPTQTNMLIAWPNESNRLCGVMRTGNMHVRRCVLCTRAKSLTSLSQSL